MHTTSILILLLLVAASPSPGRASLKQRQGKKAEPGRVRAAAAPGGNDALQLGEGLTAPGRPLFGNAPRHSCLWIRGRLRCDDGRGDHDGRTVLAYFVDGSRGRIDEAYSSKNGFFAVFGCSNDAFASSDPQLELVHDCRSKNSTTSLKFLVPYTNQPELNITEMIDLKSYYTDEFKADANDFRLPCDPF